MSQITGRSVVLITRAQENALVVDTVVKINRRAKMTGEQLYKKYVELQEDLCGFDPWEAFDDSMHEGWNRLAFWLETFWFTEKTNENR